MSLYIDKKFLLEYSPNLQLFKATGPYTFNFRCPICGDSKKNKRKCRGYFYKFKGNLVYSCKNCHASMSFGNFLKLQSPPLFQRYIMERYQEEGRGSNVEKPDFSNIGRKPVFEKKPVPFLSIPSVKTLPHDHPAITELKRRQIPFKHWDNIYFTQDYKSFCVDLFPQRFEDRSRKLPDNDERLVFPYKDLDGNLIGCIGRALINKEPRYITMKVSDEASKIYGLTNIDFKRPIFVVEGPIDSLFLENALATMDGALYTILNDADVAFENPDFVFVYDNQPRNTAVVKCMQKTIEDGQKIVVWPDDIKLKDINDMVLAGLDPQKIISENTHQGLKAQLLFDKWKRT